MAVLCRPLSGKDVLVTEKEYNVIIYRKLIYDSQAGVEALAKHLRSMSIPLKFLFIFGLNDCVLVNSVDDMHTALQRLLTM